MRRVKKIGNKEYKIKVIREGSIGYLNYKKKYDEIIELNQFVRPSERLPMERQYSKIRNKILAVLTIYNLPSSYFNDLLNALLRWSDDFEYRAMEGIQESKKDKDTLFLPSFDRPDFDEVKSDYDDLEITCATLSPIITSYIRNNPKSKPICKGLLNEIRRRRDDAKKTYEALEAHFKNGKAFSIRDKAIYEIYSLLSKTNISHRQKDFYNDIFELLQTVYGLTVGKAQTPNKWIASAISRHNKKPKK